MPRVAGNWRFAAARLQIGWTCKVRLRFLGVRVADEFFFSVMARGEIGKAVRIVAKTSAASLPMGLGRLNQIVIIFRKFEQVPAVCRKIPLSVDKALLRMLQMRKWHEQRAYVAHFPEPLSSCNHPSLPSSLTGRKRRYAGKR